MDFESLIPPNHTSTASPECSDSTSTQSTSAPNITSGILSPLMLLLTLGGVASRLLLSFAVPTLIASWTHGSILVFYLGVSSISAHPMQPFTMTERQTSTVSSVLTIPLKGWPNTGYCATMRFGENKQQIFCMIVDTGSSNTAIASTPHTALGGMEFFDIHSTGDEFINVSKSVGVTYSSGEWSGYLVKGKVGLGDLSMVEGVFALITSSDKFFIERADWAGILGLAYRSLAKPEPGVGTVWDSVRETNGLQDVFTMQLCPPRESTLFPGTFVRQGGYMTLGGINTSLYHTNKPIHYTKIVEERFFNVLLTDISVGDRKLNISCKEFNTDKTIVDSGTTDIYFPEKVFEAIKDCFTEYFKGGLPIVVPEEFWIGERKLLWQAAHVEEIYECFPTIHLSMADHQNSSQQFTLAIVPQVITYSTYSSRSTAGCWCQVFRNTVW
ncbi:Beta-secretase [Geodia barretti]|uniref:Beta-secretase n=1 Tax=Geodia barretti TaxID=519541 RepID=A0AA35SFJ8_GEOBA|nr:Beta-secretase [Geodia barretti]